MQTISAEEFRKRYGSQGESKFTPPQEGYKPGNVIANAFKSGVNQIKEGFKQGVTNNKSANPLKVAGNLIEGVGKAGSGVINAATSPLAPITEPTIGAGINYVGDKLANTQPVQKLANSKAGQVISRGAEDVANYANIAGAVGGAMEAPKVGTAVKNTTTGIAEKGVNAVNTVKEKINPTIDLESQTLIDATPAYSKKIINQPGIKNPDGTITPRVQEGGLIKGRQVTPNSYEKSAATELAKVPNYPLQGTNLEKFQAVQPEITRRGQELTTSLQNENILRPPQQIRKVISDAINKVPEESLLLQKSDPVIQNYLRVAKNAISKADGTLAGELKVRQLLDAAYKNARGKMAFGSDKISALDDIHTAARDALNADIIAKAKNTDVKASLKAQWDLMRASDVLRDKAEAEAQTSIGRFQQKNPITSKVIRGAGRAAGIGVGVDLLH